MVLMKLLLLAALTLCAADEFTFEEKEASASAAPIAAADAAPAAGQAALPAEASAAPSPAAAAAAPPVPAPSFISKLWTFLMALMGAAAVALHYFGRWRNAALAEAAGSALAPTLRANFSHPLVASALPREDGQPAPSTNKSGLYAVSFDDFEGWSSGRQGVVLGALASLRMQARTKPAYWLPEAVLQVVGRVAGPASDLLTLEVPLAPAGLPLGILSLVDSSAAAAVRQRGDLAAHVQEKDASLRGLVPALASSLVALGDQPALYSALLKAAPGLEAALQPGTPTLKCLHSFSITDSATLAGLRTCKLSEHCIVVKVRCPARAEDALLWGETLGAWAKVALASADALVGLKPAGQAALESARAAHRRKQVEAKLAAEKQEKERLAMAMLTPGALAGPAARLSPLPPEFLRLTNCTHPHTPLHPLPFCSGAREENV